MLLKLTRRSLIVKSAFFQAVVFVEFHILGKNIGTRGHLIKDGGDLVLYENHVSAALGGREAAVLIVAGSFEEASEQLIERNVVVVGDFGLNDAGWWSEIALTKGPGEIAVLE